MNNRSLRQWVSFGRIVLFGFGALLLFPLQLAGNTDYVQSSIHDGQTPYMVVRKDEDGPSQRAPGIYYGDENGDWHLALDGPVLAGQNSQGIVAQLSLTQSTGRHESVAVIDGQLTFFSNLTRLERDDTKAILDGELISPVDLFSRAPFALDPIESLSNVTVRPLGKRADGEAVLVSVRQPSPFGEGVTFVVFVRAPGHEDDVDKSEMVIDEEPFIVDYQFRSYHDLERLNFSGEYVLSEQVFKVLSRSNKKDTPSVRFWRSLLKEEIQRFSRGQDFEQIDAIPMVDVSDASIVLDSPPSQDLFSGDIALSQFYDPIRGNHRLYLGAEIEDPDEVKPIFHGEVDYDFEAGEYKIYDSSDDSHVGLFISKGDLILIVDPDGSGNDIITLNLDSNMAADAESLVMENHEVELGFKEKLHHIFVSDRRSGKTVVYLVSRVANSLNYQKSMTLMAESMDKGELENRIVPGKGKNILFDNITPIQGSADDYIEANRQTQPYMDVTASSTAHFVQAYVKPLEIVKIDDRLSYRRFDPEGARENLSGIYEVDKDDGESRVIPGSLLRRDEENDPTPDLVETEFHLNKKSEKNIDGKVRLIGMDPKFGSGRRGFNLVTHISPSEDSEFLPSLNQIELPIEFDRITSVNVMSGFKNYQNRLMVVFSYDPIDGYDPEKSESSKSDAGGAFMLTFKLKETTEGNKSKPTVLIEKLNEQTLAYGDLSGKDVAKRIAADKAGRVYWVKTPGVSRTDAGFKLLNVFEGKEVLPNSRAGRNLSILYDEEARKAGLAVTQTEDEGRVDNPWLVQSRSGLKSIIDYKADEEAQKKLKEESKLYPGLINLFERLSNPRQPASHEVILVSDEQKETLRKLIVHSLERDAGNSSWNIHNQSLNFAVFNSDAATQLDVMQNLSFLRDIKANEASVLYADLQQLSAIGRPGGVSDDEPLMTLPAREGEGSSEDLPHILDLISREGRIETPADFGSPPESQAQISTIILATPDEWERVKFEREEEKEVQSRFSVNVDFLHASWKVWPPGTKKTSDEVKQVQRLQSSSLEQEIFPGLLENLEVLSDPSVPAKHQVVIVPEDLKPVLNRMILKAWVNKRDDARGRSKSKNWSLNNPRLRLFQINRSDSSQSNVFDNFRAMRGSANARSRGVLWGDLETIQQIGRPSVSSGPRRFLIQDPATSKKSAALWSQEKREGLEEDDEPIEPLEIRVDEVLRDLPFDKDLIHDVMRGNVVLTDNRTNPLNRTATFAVLNKYIEKNDEDAEKWGIPKDLDEAAQQERQAEAQKASEAELFDEEEDDETNKFPPHLMWLIASEGERLTPSQLSDRVTKGEEAAQRVSTLLIGTQEEWERLERDLQLEARFGLLDSFEINELTPPTSDTKKRLLMQILNRPEIRSLNYEFKVEEDRAREGVSPKVLLVGYLVNRTAALARQFDIENTTAFIRVMNEFSEALVQDQILRTSKVLDQAFIERLLTRVFNIPLNIKSLPEDDPLVKLNNVRNMAFALQEVGYLGPLELKYQWTEGLLKQLRGSYSGSRVPSSVILYGDTSTGKTFLFERTMKVLGRQLYDFENPTDPDASAIIVNVGELVEGADDFASGVMDVDRAIDHIRNFLSLPNGYRGYILFDDIHKGSKEVINKLLAFQQSLFEAPEGMIWVNPLDEEDQQRQIPVRNISMVMTINPPSDKQMIGRFASSGNIVDMLIASLAQKGVTIEKSYVARWSTVLNLNVFPLEAKGPALFQELRNTTQNDFNLNGSLTLVDPATIRAISTAFPEENAREFLSSATAEVIRVAEENTKDQKIRIVTPVERKDHLGQGEDANNNLRTTRARFQSFEGTGRASSKIRSYVSDWMMAHEVSSGKIDGRLLLISLIAGSIRTHAYQAFASSLSQDVNLVDDHQIRKNVLGPTLHALTSHLEERPFMPLSVLNIDPHDFGIRTQEGRKNWARALEQYESLEEGSRFFPLRFSDEFLRPGAYRELVDSAFFRTAERSRAQLMTTTSVKLQSVFTKLLSKLLRVENVHDLPKPEDWLSKLPEDDPNGVLQETGEEVLKIFHEFRREIFNQELIEVSNSDGFQHPDVFGIMRLYLLCLDKALSKLPWVRAQTLLVRGLELAASDLDYGQLPGVQHFLFETKYSLVQPSSLEYVFQLSKSSEVYNEWSPEKEKQMAERFRDTCRDYIVQFRKDQKGAKP